VSAREPTKSVATRSSSLDEIAVASEGGPLVAEGGPVVARAELKPLTIRPQLALALPEATDTEPAVATIGWRWLFLWTVVLPMALASIYLFGLAAPRFTSSASFIVRSAAPQSGDPIAALSEESASSIARDETNAVAAYLTSRDVVAQLGQNNSLRAILSRPNADFLFRYPTFWMPDDNEHLYKRFQWMVDAKVDPITSISTLEANAFSAEDAHAIVVAMLGYAEALVNQMNERAYKDGLTSANRFVAEAQKDLESVEDALKAYRNASGSVDPNAVAQSKLKVIEGLSTELARVEAAIAQQIAITPNAPTLAGLRASADSYRKEIDKRKLEIAGSAGSEAAKLEQYEKLVLQRELAAKALAAAETERNEALQDTQRQHLYIQLISQPNLSSDFARYPRVGIDLLALLAVCLGVFQLLRLLCGITAEHQA
jgi:capsular polysaccharide transport system permease protein